MTLSIEGFRFQMTPRAAKLAAEEHGWTLNSLRTFNTFEDIIEDRTANNNKSVDLKRDRPEFINLEFDHGVLNNITYENHILEKQQAEDLLKQYLVRFPQLEMSTTGDHARTYKYERGKGFIIIQILHMKNSSIYVFAFYDY